MQLNFLFPNNTDIYDVRNFIVHDGNRSVFDFITSSTLINNNIYLLTGVKNSGKTYISNIWNKLKGANFIDSSIFKSDSFIEYLNKNILNGGRYILENIELLNLTDEQLLYLLNTTTEKKALLLITSQRSLDEFEFKLPDLNSRFSNITNFVLREINEESKQKIILKLLSDKQMNIETRTLEYIARKISGNYSAIIEFVNKLEDIVQSNKIKRITINNVKDLLT